MSRAGKGYRGAVRDPRIADEVVGFGELLLDRGEDQVAQSDDEGETAKGVTACLASVMRALASPALSDTGGHVCSTDAH